LEPLAVFDKGRQKTMEESPNHNYKENYKNESSKKEQLRSCKDFEDRFGKSF